jgi:hypothetical protein
MSRERVRGESMAEQKDKHWPIEVVSVSRVKPEFKWDSGLRITFRVKRDPDYMSFESTFSTPVGVDDSDAVRLARNYFHRTMAHVAEQSEGWKLTEEEVKGLVPS